MRVSVFVLLCCMFISGCASYVGIIPSSLSVSTQQAIKSVKLSKNINYKFTPLPSAENVEYPWSVLRIKTYNINEAVNSLFTEWAETKFGAINDNSTDKVKIQITNIESICNNMGMTLSGSMLIEVKITGIIGGVELDRKSSYKTSFDPQTQDTAIAAILEKLVISLDKYVDSQLEVQ